MTCIDDVPAVARLAARQQFLNKWYRPVALAPFVLVLIANFWIFPGTAISSELFADVT